MDQKQAQLCMCMYKSSSVLVSRFFRSEQAKATRKTPQTMCDEGRSRKRQFGQVGASNDDMEVRSLRARCKVQEDQIRELRVQLQKANDKVRKAKDKLLTTTQKCQALEVENAGLKAQVDPFGVPIFDASPNACNVEQPPSDTSTSSSLALQVGSPPSGATAAAVFIPGGASATSSPTQSLALSDDAPESLLRNVVAAASKPSGSGAK